jgi:hypothetical protein
VSVVNLATRVETRRIATTPITGEPFPADVLLGAKIFHRSDDPRISRSGKMSCASCHINAEHDGRTWANDHLPGNHGPRATPSLLGLRLSAGRANPATGFGQFHRSGDRDEIQDFEHTFQGVQMGGTGFSAPTRNRDGRCPTPGAAPNWMRWPATCCSSIPCPAVPGEQPPVALSEAAIRGATFFSGTNRRHAAPIPDVPAAMSRKQDSLDRKFHNVGQRRDSAEHELNNRTPPGASTPQASWARGPPLLCRHHQRTEAIMPSTACSVCLRDAIGRANTTTNHGNPTPSPFVRCAIWRNSFSASTGT